MKINNFTKIILTTIVLFSLVACTSEKYDKKDPIDPIPDDSVVEPLPLEIVYSLLGKEYTMPTSYQRLKDDGWVLEDDVNFVLKSGEFISNRFIRNGPHILDVTFYNESEEDQILEDSLIAGVASENRTFGMDEASDIIVHNSIEFDSNIDDIIQMLGDYELEESAQFDTYTFQHDNLSKTQIKYDIDTDSIRWIIIESFKTD